MNDDIAFEWWRQTSGPRRLLHNLTADALAGRCCATDIKAEDEFFDVFAAVVSSEDSAVSIEREEIAGDTSDDDFLHELLSRYAPPDYVIDILSDSPFSGLAENNALGQRIIFVTLFGRCLWAAKVGAAFNRGAKKNPGNRGALIFLTEYLDEDFSSGCGVEKLRAADYITAYDAQSFAGHLLAERGMMDSGKRLYTSGLAAKIIASAQNYDLAAQIAVPQLYREPTEVARRVMGDDFSEEQCVRSIWEMQIQTVLPISENVRQRLITNYEKNLANIVLNPIEDDFGNILTEPLDMELRHLRFYGADGRFFSAADWEELNFVCDMRNRLAHLRILPSEELDRIFALT